MSLRDFRQGTAGSDLHVVGDHMGPSVENSLQGHSFSERPLLISGLMIWVTTGELTMRKLVTGTGVLVLQVEAGGTR